MSNKKVAMVGTPCQILAATKVNRYTDFTGGSPIDVKIGLFCMENFSYSYLERFLKENDIELYEVKVINGQLHIDLKRLFYCIFNWW